jgi:PHD/YefM family antitoxin component YafN of YafNO toxin-antitoxin module
MNTITAQEIKRRGISAVDERVKKGPVHVIKNNKPQYVIMDEAFYEELIAEREESYLARLKLSLNELREGKVQRFETVKELMNAIDRLTE